MSFAAAHDRPARRRRRRVSRVQGPLGRLPRALHQGPRRHRCRDRRTGRHRGRPRRPPAAGHRRVARGRGRRAWPGGGRRRPENRGVRHRHRVLWQDRWLGFRTWFAVPEPPEPGEAAASRRRAIPQLLQVVASLNERRGGRSTGPRTCRLARWFAQAPTDEDLHRLWRVAFGLRRPGTSALPRTATAQCRPRRHGRMHHRWTSVRGCAEPAATRAAASRTASWTVPRMDATWLSFAAKEAAETAAARERLATARPTRLADLGELDLLFRLFLALLGDALAGRAAGSSVVETTTSDGTLAIRLTARRRPDRGDPDTTRCLPRAGPPGRDRRPDVGRGGGADRVSP